MSLFLPKEMVIRDGNLPLVKPTIITFDPQHGCKRDMGDVMISLEFCVERKVSSKIFFGDACLTLYTLSIQLNIGNIRGIIAEKIPGVEWNPWGSIICQVTTIVTAPPRGASAPLCEASPTHPFGAA